MGIHGQEQEGKVPDLHRGERGGSVANFHSGRTTTWRNVENDECCYLNKRVSTYFGERKANSGCSSYG